MGVDDRRGDVDELPAGATRVRAQHVECLPFVDRMPRHRIPFARSVIARRSDALQILARFCTRLSEVRFLRLASISGQMGLAASAIGRPSISSLDRRPRHDASGTRDRVAVANRRAEAQRAARPDRLVGRRHVRRLRHGRGGHEYGTYARGKPRCADARSRALDRGRPPRSEPGTVRGRLVLLVHRQAVSVAREKRRSNPSTEMEAIPQNASRFLERLPAAEREAVALAYFGGLTLSEVALVTGAARETVGRLVSSGLGFLCQPSVEPAADTASARKIVAPTRTSVAPSSAATR